MKESKRQKGAAAIRPLVVAGAISAFVAAFAVGPNPFPMPKPGNCDDYHRAGVYSCKWSGTQCDRSLPNSSLNVLCWVRCCYDQNNNLISETWQNAGDCVGVGGCTFSIPCCDADGSCSAALNALKADKPCPNPRPYP